MATASRASTTSLSRQIESVRRTAGEAAAAMPQAIADGSREIGRRANALVEEASRGVRQHPWAALGVVAGAALLGGLLFARRR